MAFFSWCSRRVGGLSLLALIFLCSWVLIYEIRSTRHDAAAYGKKSNHQVNFTNGPRVSRIEAIIPIAFAWYSLFIHLLVTLFPFRACWGIWDVTRNLKKAAQSTSEELKSLSTERKFSSSSLSSAETLTPSSPSSTSSDTEDFESVYTNTSSENRRSRPIHAVLIPNYKEDIDVLRETLVVLASHPWARCQYDIYLAMESRESGCDVKALSLVSDFLKKFRYIEFTVHPADIPNDSPGKSSNISWAARKASERYNLHSRDDVIITVIDADSHLPSMYFKQLTAMHLEYPKTAATTLYAAPIVFDRNAHIVPALVRIADIQWCAGGISGLYARSSIRPPTSVYSLPLSLADKVGGWDSDCEAIGEDLHMYAKCFFALNGTLTTRTILAPVSQTNVSCGLKGAQGKIGDCGARYKQGLRHMWGSLDSGYALRKVAEVWRERKRNVRTFRPLHENSNEKIEYIPETDFDNILHHQNSDTGAFSNICYHKVENPDWRRIVGLLHRLFEAHCLPSHMMVLVITTSIYVFLTQDKPDTHHIGWIFTITAYLRIIGFLTVAVYLNLYESFHHFAVNTRKAEMKAAGLYDGMENSFSTRSFWKNKLDYILIPVAAPIFGSIPAIQAQFSHFWTLDLVYTVSKKPSRAPPTIKTSDSFA